MGLNRKILCGAALTVCLVLIFSSQAVCAMASNGNGVTAAGANSPGSTAVDTSFSSSSLDAAAARAHVNLEPAKAAAVRAERNVPDTETTAKGVSGLASGAAEVSIRAAPSAPTRRGNRVATPASASSTSDESHTTTTTATPEDYGPIITGSAITGLVVVICFSGVLTLLVLVEIVPHAQRWLHACRGESQEKTEEEITADRAYEQAARDRVEQALHREGNGKAKIETMGGIDSPVMQTE